MWIRFKSAVERLFEAGPEETRLSRRDFLTGLGCCGAIAVAAPALLGPGSAQADAVDELLGDAQSEPETELAQWSPPRRRRRHRRRHRRRRGRRRRGRMSAREVRRRCRYSRRFRRRNWDLCERVRGWRGRRGACVQIGPIQICE
ncbi:MAG: twin-arginine translocation signal domain-containing protein [Hyphomicrobiales bacterium]